MILLSHPTGNQNVRGVLKALHLSGELGVFATTIGHSLSTRSPCWLRGKLRREWDRRTYDLPKSLIWRRPLREAGRIIAGRLRLKPLIRHESGPFCIDAVYRGLDCAVKRNLARFVRKNGIAGVYGYEDGCAYTFEAAAHLGIARFYDLPIAYWSTARKLLEEEAQRFPAWEPTLSGTRDSAKKHERKTRELELANLVICPSKFVASSIPESIRQVKEVLIAPFGSPEIADGIAAERPAGSPLRVLFAGALTQRKGLADLFAALQLLNRHDVELVVMGSPIAPMEFYFSQFSRFTYEPPRPHADVLRLMRSCDVLVLPSIVEGRALVIQEAMSQGLPVIITPNAGADDLIIEGMTGFLVPIRAPEIIAERIAWLAGHRSDARAMGLQAQAKAATYTWEQYGETITNKIQQCLNDHPLVGHTR
jgi:glycosyltransferase involved in cell wall biosynthesis